MHIDKEVRSAIHRDMPPARMGVHTDKDETLNAYFDSTLEADPVQEQIYDPAIPEDRHVFELVGFERSEPDRWRKEGGIRWTFLVFLEDGRTPYRFNDEHYTLLRTTSIDKKTQKPLFTEGTFANDWASALLGRPLGVDAHFAISELRGKRFSAMVVWEKQREDPRKKSIKLASLRHVPVSVNGTAPAPAPIAAQVSADPSEDDVDRALLVTALTKSIARLTKLDAASGKNAAKALADSPTNARLDDLAALHEQVKAAIQTALDD